MVCNCGVEFCTHSIALVGGGGVTSPVSLLIFLPSYLLVVDWGVEIPPSVLTDFLLVAFLFNFSHICQLSFCVCNLEVLFLSGFTPYYII